MAKKENIAELIPVVAPAQVVTTTQSVVLCQDCKFWRRRQAAPGTRANLGECDFSRTFLPSPQMTTDMSTCSQATLA